MPPEVEKVAMKEFKRMSRMNPSAAEYTVSRTYIDWLVDIPWSHSSQDNLDIQRASDILDEDQRLKDIATVNTPVGQRGFFFANPKNPKID